MMALRLVDLPSSGLGRRWIFNNVVVGLVLVQRRTLGEAWQLGIFWWLWCAFGSGGCWPGKPCGTRGGCYCLEFRVFFRFGLDPLGVWAWLNDCSWLAPCQSRFGSRTGHMIVLNFVQEYDAVLLIPFVLCIIFKH